MTVRELKSFLDTCDDDAIVRVAAETGCSLEVVDTECDGDEPVLLIGDPSGIHTYGIEEV